MAAARSVELPLFCHRADCFFGPPGVLRRGAGADAEPAGLVPVRWFDGHAAIEVDGAALPRRDGGGGRRAHPAHAVRRGAGRGHLVSRHVLPRGAVPASATATPAGGLAPSWTTFGLTQVCEASRAGHAEAGSTSCVRGRRGAAVDRFFRQCGHRHGRRVAGRRADGPALAAAGDACTHAWRSISATGRWRCWSTHAPPAGLARHTHRGGAARISVSATLIWGRQRPRRPGCRWHQRLSSPPRASLGLRRHRGRRGRSRLRAARGRGESPGRRLSPLTRVGRRSRRTAALAAAPTRGTPRTRAQTYAAAVAGTLRTAVCRADLRRLRRPHHRRARAGGRGGGLGRRSSAGTTCSRTRSGAGSRTRPWR